MGEERTAHVLAERKRGLRAVGTGLIAYLAADAELANARGDGIEGFGGSLEETFCRGFTRDGVDGDRLRANTAQGVEPRPHVGVAGVVHIVALPGACEEHGLDNCVPL